MSRARGDVNTWQILFGVWVCLELTEPLWWLCNQISQNNENRNSLRASSPFKGYQEKSCANGTQKEMQEQGVGKESESLSFPLSFRALPLTHAFTCHSKWRVCSQFITFLCSHAYLLFGEPVYVWNSEEKFKLFTYWATSTTAPHLLLQPFQPTLNNSHLSDTKNPVTYWYV